MNIKIKTLKISNFKGIRDLEIDFEQTNIIMGRNATGKTTIIDAVQWLLFGKNSAEDKVFSVKPIDPETKEDIHHLVVSVEGVLNVNGVDIVLRKELEENWVTQRGTNVENFAGNVTNTYIDGVPKGMREYEKYISDIIPTELFKLLTNPLAFNSSDWQSRRKVILSFAGELSNEYICSLDPKLRGFEKVLGTKSCDDLKKQTQASLLKVKDDQNRLPSQISEVKRLIVETINTDEIKAAIEAVEKQEEEIQVAKSANDNSLQILQLKKEVQEVENKKGEIEYSLRRKISDERRIIEEECQELEKSLRKNEEAKILSTNNIKLLNTSIDVKKKMIEDNEKQITELYAKYDKIEEQYFTPGLCAFCKSPLPEEKVKELQEEFNNEKSLKLERIVAEGKNLREKCNELEEVIKFYKSNIETERTTIHVVDKEYEEIKAKLAEQRIKLSEVKPLSIFDHSDWIALNNKSNELLLRISNLANASESVKQFDKELSELKYRKNELQYALLQQENNLKNLARVEELEAQFRKAGQNKVDLDNTLILIDLVVVAKINALEHKINDGFKYVQWKLFDRQINGGVAETCVATVDGVPFKDLNNAMKINAGLDIIRWLQAQHNAKAFIFVDNAESINSVEMIDDTQIITLYVTDDETLKFHSTDHHIISCENGVCAVEGGK